MREDEGHWYDHVEENDVWELNGEVYKSSCGAGSSWVDVVSGEKRISWSVALVMIHTAKRVSRVGLS